MSSLRAHMLHGCALLLLLPDAPACTQLYRTVTEDEAHEQALMLGSVAYNYDELLSLENDA